MDGIEQIRRELERAWRGIDAELAAIQRQIEQATVHAPNVRARSLAVLAAARRRPDVLPGRWWQRPGPGPGPRRDCGGEPDAAPVRPFHPSGLSGGAAAPLDP